MSQETRKDPRAKVLTMTVRYKSATLDEFIEHHSYDISRGGMFIKTPSPFPPGTLLKFEVKIADEQRLLQGVGRVVWKREKSASPGEESPSGMGVKFIKINEEAQALIQDLTGRRSAAGAFEAGGGDADVDSLPTPGAPGGSAPMGPRKGTMLGLGSISSAAENLSPPESGKDTKFFPDSGSSEADMPAPEDRTVMKQTAELLRDALREAGGSEAELGAPAQPAVAEPANADSAGDTESASGGAVASKPQKSLSQPPPSRSQQSRDGRRSNRPGPASSPPQAASANSTVPPARKRKPLGSAAAQLVNAKQESTGQGMLGGIILGLVALGAVVYFLLIKPAAPPPPVPVPAAQAAPEPTPQAATEIAPAPSAPAPSAPAPSAPAPSANPIPAANLPSTPATPIPAVVAPKVPPATHAAAPAEKKPAAEPKPAAEKPAKPPKAPKSPAADSDNPY